MIILEHGPGAGPALFDNAREVILAHDLAGVGPALARADAARAAGAWVAGYLAYEAGYAFEPRLAPLYQPKPSAALGPLVALGVYDAPSPADAALARAGELARDLGDAPPLAPVHPGVARGDYDAAFARVMDYIAAGDCYQINLTFPLHTQLLAGSPLALYGAMRGRQAVGYGAYVDLGHGPVVLSRSPELFFSVTDGLIRARPMKGTAPRDPDPARDRALMDELSASEKAQAENLMIVDLLRNDIGRISRLGSVRVPELYAIDSFATVHQMSSTVEGRLLANAGMGDLMAALFPCGSVTGAPKIRAMQIIAGVEDGPRGPYCGAVGWMGPNGDCAWNVAIRTLSVWPDGVVRLNVGGGVVQDSTMSGEWDEALWKARFLNGLTAPVGANG